MRDPASAGGTNWWSLPVDQMWSMIERHDSAALHPLINGWRRSYELVLEHLSSVKRYRESLATAWPPERSPAARTYLDRLDTLIRSLEETYEAATINHRAFTMATGALDTTRRAMREIHQEYAANQAALATYRDDMRMYHLVGGKAKGVPPQSPIPDARQAELEQRARRVMSALSAELAQAQVSIITPKPYMSPSVASTRDESISPRTTSSSVPFTGASADSLHTRQLVEPSLNSKLPLPPAVGSESAYSPPGPVLAGMPPLERDDSSAATSLPTSARSISTGAQHVYPPMGIIGPTPSSLKAHISSSDTPRSSNHSDKSQPPPSGSIIGGQPAPSRQPSTTQRVNPVGGVIGSPYISSTASPSTGERSRENRSARAMRANNVWEVAQGIDPVLAPPKEKPIDPGPAIGLSRQ